MNESKTDILWRLRDLSPGYGNIIKDAVDEIERLRSSAPQGEAEKPTRPVNHYPVQCPPDGYPFEGGKLVSNDYVVTPSPSAPQGDGRAGLVLCEACQSEGRILTSDGGPDETDNGECPVCKGRGELPLEAACDWPNKPFTFYDEPGEHDPCYVVLPDGAMLSLNHHAGKGVDIARAKFIIAACNAALSAPPSVALEARNAVIEECAKIADTAALRCVREQIPGDAAAKFVAQNIRALTRPQPGGEQ